MLKVPCLHPKMLHALSKCGHGDKILIADGNYPIDSNTNMNTEKVYLNLAHGIPLVTDVLKVIREMITIEKLEMMVPEDNKTPEIVNEIISLSPLKDIDRLNRAEFYETCKADNIKLAIATGEQRTYANVLITVGVI